jgi:hypothetical protein
MVGCGNMNNEERQRNQSKIQQMISFSPLHSSSSSSLVSCVAISKHIVSIFLFSSLIAACIILSSTLQPTYQEEQREQELTKQYFWLVSALMGQSQLPSANSVPVSTNNVSTYQNSSLGLSLQYPSDWKVEERTNIANNNNNTASSTKFSSPSKKDLMVVSVYTQNLSSLPIEQQQQNITLDSLTRTGINAAKQNLSNLQFLDLETANVTLGLGQNNQAHKVIYSNTNNNATFPLQFVTMQIYTIKDDNIYGISYVSEASQFFRHLPAVQRMIDSFQIIG